MFNKQFSIFIFLFSCFIFSAFAQLDVAQIELINDVDEVRYATRELGFDRLEPIRFFQWESVQLDVTALHGETPAVLTNDDVFLRWEAYSEEESTNAAIHKVGTVVDASAGQGRITLTPSEAGLPAGEYYSYVRAFQPIDGENVYIGVVAYNRLIVKWAPNPSSYTYTGPYPVLDLSGYVTTNDFQALETEVAGVITNLANLTNDFQALEAVVGAATGEVASLTSDLGSLTSDFQGLETNVYTKAEADTLAAGAVQNNGGSATNLTVFGELRFPMSGFGTNYHSWSWDENDEYLKLGNTDNNHSAQLGNISLVQGDIGGPGLEEDNNYFGINLHDGYFYGGGASISSIFWKFDRVAGLDMHSTILKNPLDPTAGNMVGDRDYNDARYAGLTDFQTLETNVVSLTEAQSALSNQVSDLDLDFQTLETNVYTKAEADTLLDGKADASITNDVLALVSDAAQINSRIVPATNVMITYTWPATNDNGTVYIFSPTNTWIAPTGSIEYATTDGSYLVDVDGEVELADWPAGGIPPLDPVMRSSITRLSDTSIVFKAWCVGGGNSTYWATLTNAIPYTYDLAGMSPNSITNDGAGVIQRADNLPDGWESLEDGRLVVNAQSLHDYVAEMVEVAASKWANYTASGTRAPSSAFVTIDEPMIQQGTVSYMQSGDYYCQSYVGGDWWLTTEGSEWWIGPSGSKAFGVSSTNKLLNIISFDVSGGVATLDISTNGVVGDPEILTTDSLGTSEEPAQWVKCPSQTMTNMTTYWRGQCDASVDMRFYRAVSAGGESLVINKYPAVFEVGIADGDGNVMTLQTNTINGTSYQFYGRILP